MFMVKGLANAFTNKIVDIPDRIQFKSGKTMAKWYVEAGNLSKEQRALVRSKTFPGIAYQCKNYGNANVYKLEVEKIKWKNRKEK